MRLYGPKGRRSCWRRRCSWGWSGAIRSPSGGGKAGDGSGESERRNGRGTTSRLRDRTRWLVGGYAVREHERRGKFDVDKARRRIPKPAVGQASARASRRAAGRSESRTGRHCGANRPGARGFHGDTRPVPPFIDAAQGRLIDSRGDLWEERRSGPRRRAFDGARGGADRARGKARRLVLSHVSARYSISAEELVKEAREVFGRRRSQRMG